MVKQTYVLVACVWCMLAASVVVVVVSVVFHPSKSETAILIKELKGEVTCALCKARLDRSSTECEKCFQKQTETWNEPERSCQLTKNKREQLTQVVENRFDMDTRKRLKSTMGKVAGMHQHNFQQLSKRIANLNLNVPRPSAHWYVSKTPQRTGTSMKLNVSSWQWRTNSDIAHSQNGITHHGDGLMKFSVAGWYHVYYQMDFLSNIKTKKSYKARLFVPSGVKDDEKNALFTSEEKRRCGHGKQSSHGTKLHSCVVLSGSGIFEIHKDDEIRVQIDVPAGAALHADKSRSYFGALYVRHAG